MPAYVFCVYLRMWSKGTKKRTVCAGVKNAWHAVSRMYNQVGADKELSTAVGFVLLNIPPEGIPVTHLGPQLGLEARSLSRMLNNLERKGWLKRSADAKDKRMVRVTLTQEGVLMRQQSSRTVKSFHEYIAGQCSAEELEAFFRVSNLIAEHSKTFAEQQNNGQEIQAT